MNEILIYDDIGASWFDEGVTAKGVKAQLEEMAGDITVRINSGGGDVFEGFAIYNLLDQHNGNITVHIDGLAASAASVIAMAGDDINMGINALMMIHDPWTFAIGNSSDLAKTGELLDKIKDSIVNTYEKQTELDKNYISDLMAAETWMTADEAISDGFATKPEENDEKAFNFSKLWIKNAPKQEKPVQKQEKPAEDSLLSDEVVAKLEEPEKELYKVNLLKRKMALIDI